MAEPNAESTASAPPSTPPVEDKRSSGGGLEFFRKRFVAGLITVIPAIITVWAVVILVNVLREIFGPLIRPSLRTLARRLDSIEDFPQLFVSYLAFVEPLTILLSFVSALVLIFMIGWLTRFLFFRRIVRFGERTVQRIPLIRFFYKTPKEVLKTITQTKGSFKRVVLIEYPRRGIWCIAYATGEMRLEPDGREMVTVFLPTTPNPTSGFLLILPREDVRDINLGVENAVRFIISAGILSPEAVHTATFVGMDNDPDLPPPPLLSVDFESMTDVPKNAVKDDPIPPMKD